MKQPDDTGPHRKQHGLHRGQPTQRREKSDDVRRLARATGATELGKMSPRTASSLQRLIGNQRVSYLARHADLLPRRQPSDSVAAIHRWPAPEVDDQPDPQQFSMFKCHDAVVYWVLRSTDLAADEAAAALNLLQRKKGPSAGWIVEALGYERGSRINTPDDVGRGDILFTGATSYVAHTMVVLDAANIKGFNNFGTFGTAAGGDQYSVENFADGSFWHDVGGKPQIGTRDDASFPIYRLSIGTAQDALRQYVKTISEGDADYSNPNMNVGSVSIPELKKRKGCYITTAVMMTRGSPDDCEELEVLRAFRDSYLLDKPNGAELALIYYEHAPLILEEIANQPHPASIYRYLYDVIRFCVAAIKNGEDELAYRTYCHMVIELKERFLPDLTVRYQL